MSRRAAAATDVAVLAVLCVLGFGPLLAMLRHADAGGLVFAGADGPFAADQFQYFAWIREYSTGLLADNDLDLAASADVFPHPMFGLSGLMVAAGLSVPLAYLLFKPVAIAVLFLGTRAYVRRFIEARGARAAALAVAVLFASPAMLLSDEVIVAAGEMFAAALLWGYLPAVIAVGLMPVFLLGVERLARADPGARGPRVKDVLVVCGAGALASWLHPWQGQVLLVTVVAAFVLDRRGPRRYAAPAIACAATFAPILGYFVLSLTDDAWSRAAEANEAIGRIPLWTVALALAPLAALAAAGARTPPRDLGETMLRVWPVASIVVYLLLSPSFAQHALEGIGIPLAVLAARAWPERPRRATATAAALLVAILVVPGALRFADWMHDTVSAPGQAHYLRPSERDALDHLEAVSGAGGVLTSARLGALVPSATGRRSWLGHPSWTRDYERRAADAGALFGGRLRARAAQRLVRGSRARFVLADCDASPAARAALDRVTGERRAFGCATVYRVATS